MTSLPSAPSRFRRLHVSSLSRSSLPADCQPDPDIGHRLQPRGPVRGHARGLILGQLIGQLALVLAIPFLTRLLSVTEMGVYQTAFSVALILQPLATLRQELLIPVSGANEARRHRYIGLGFAGICSSAAGLTALVLWALARERMAEVFLTIALVLFAFALVTIENAYLIRRSRFGRLALRNLLSGVGSASLQVVAALLFSSALAIAAALLLGRLIATVITIAHEPLAKHPTREEGHTSQRSISAIFSGMVSTASTQAVILGSFETLGAAAAAQVGVGQRIGGTPMMLVGQALSQISLGAAAPLIRERRPGLATQLRSQTLRTAGPAAIFASALIVGGPLLAVPVLGPGWEQAGVVAAIFAVPLSLQLVALPATTLLIPLGFARKLLLMQIARLAVILLALGVTSAVSGDVIATCVVTSMAWTAAYGPILTLAFRAARGHDRACHE